MGRALLLGLVGGCAAKLAPGDWPMWGQNAKYASSKDVSDAKAGDREEWTFTAGDRVVGSPAVALGRVWFGSDDGAMYCVDASTGAKVWAWRPASAEYGDCSPNYCEHGLCACGKIRSSPAVDDEGSVYFGSYDFHVYKVDKDGKTVWSVPTGGAIYGPVTLSDDGFAYVGSFDGFVYAIAASDGTVAWKAEVGSHGDAGWVIAGGLLFGQTNEGGHCSAWPPPDVPGYAEHSCDEKAPAGSADACGQCHAIALDAKTGAAKWSQNTTAPGGGGSFVGGGAEGFYVQGDWSGAVAAYDADVTGAAPTISEAARWTLNVGGDVETHPAYSVNAAGAVDAVYVSTEDPSHALYALDPATGAIKWRYNDTNATLNSSPAVTEETVYVGSNDHLLHAVDRATGARKWTFPTIATIFSSPAIDDGGMVYVGCNSATGQNTDLGLGAVYAVNPKKRASA